MKKILLILSLCIITSFAFGSNPSRSQIKTNLHSNNIYTDVNYIIHHAYYSAEHDIHYFNDFTKFLNNENFHLYLKHYEKGRKELGLPLDPYIPIVNNPSGGGSGTGGGGEPYAPITNFVKTPAE